MTGCSECPRLSEPGRGQGGFVGTYGVGHDEAFVNVGITHETADFAVASIRRWWQMLGRRTYHKTQRVLIRADAGGSNGHRRRAWKVHPQQLSDQLNLPITVCHCPPGTSKRNTIEHRDFQEDVRRECEETEMPSAFAEASADVLHMASAIRAQNSIDSVLSGGTQGSERRSPKGDWSRRSHLYGGSSQGIGGDGTPAPGGSTHLSALANVDRRRTDHRADKPQINLRLGAGPGLSAPPQCGQPGGTGASWSSSTRCGVARHRRPP